MTSLLKIRKLFLSMVFLFANAGYAVNETDYNLGLKAFQSANYIETITFMSSALNLGDLSTDHQEQAYLYRAMAKQYLGEIDSAFLDFDMTLSLNERNELARCGKGNVLNLKEKFEEALMEFNDIVDSFYRSYCGYYGRGVSNAGLDRIDSAVEDFTQVLTIKYQSIEAHLGRGVALFNLGKYLESMEDFETTIKIQPDNSLGYAGLAFNAYALGEYKEAVDFFSKALKEESELNTTYLIYIYLANQHLGKKGTGRIENYLDDVDFSTWPGVVFEYLINHKEASIMANYYANESNIKTGNVRECFAHFIIGENNFIKNNLDVAKSHYSKCIEINAKTVMAYTLARERLHNWSTRN